MIDKALNKLGIEEFVIYGDPTTEHELRECFYKVTGKDSYNNAILVKGYDQIGVSWEEIQAKINEINDAEPMRLLRIERDRLLSETDWVSTRSVDSGTPVSQEWVAYREALRDLPATADPKLENGALTNVTWPEKPE